MGQVPSIGFFQFDNLLKTRVPFLIVNLQAELAGLFRGQDWEHVQTYQLLMPLNVGVAELSQALEQKKIPKHYPVVFVCADGVVSKTLAEAMDQSGWLNCFWVFQGVLGLADRD